MSSVPLPQTLAPAMLWVIFSLEGTLRDAAAGGGASSPAPPAAATPEGATKTSQDYTTQSHIRKHPDNTSHHRHSFPATFPSRHVPRHYKHHATHTHYQPQTLTRTRNQNVQSLKQQTQPDATCTAFLRHTLPVTFLATYIQSQSVQNTNHASFTAKSLHITITDPPTNLTQPQASPTPGPNHPSHSHHPRVPSSHKFPSLPSRPKSTSNGFSYAPFPSKSL